MQCSDCGRIWALTRRVGLRDLVSPRYWRMRLGLDGAPTRRLDEERSDLGKLLLRGFVSWIVVMPIVGFAFAALLMVSGAPLRAGHARADPCGCRRSGAVRARGVECWLTNAST
jgi:hypothetical protein